MNTVTLTPMQRQIFSEFDSVEAQSAYTLWLSNKLDAAEKKSENFTAHDTVMAEVRKMLEMKQQSHVDLLV